MIVSRAGLAAMGIADGLMVARFQSHEFAWLSLAEGTLGRLLDVFIAFLIGGLSLVPRHFAQGDESGAREIWRRTIPVAIALGAAGLAAGLFGKQLLLLLRQSPELASGAGPVMGILAAGYPAALVAISAAVYLEGVGRPRVVAVSVIAANLLNILFNWLFIPGMGARGSALSTTLVRCGLCAALAGFAWRLRANRTAEPSHMAEREVSRRAQWRLGAGAAATVLTMVILGSSLTIFAGWLGVLPLAVFSASWNLAAPAALIALGMADAAGIFVAAEAGRGSAGIGNVAWASLRITLAPIAVLAAILAVRAQTFSDLYTSDKAMRESMIAVLPVVALILLVDVAGFVTGAALRALREAVWPAAIDIGSMALLVPLAAGLALGRGIGVRGLFLAMLTAGLLRALLLAGRLRWYTRNVNMEVACRTV
jgi:MATE family multidrug resistance protein